MRIEPNEIIAGMPATQIRALLRRIDEGRITPEVVGELLACRKIHASRIIRQLEAEGYITAKRDRRWGDYWESTVKGKALAAATAARPLHRETGKTRSSSVRTRPVGQHRRSVGVPCAGDRTIRKLCRAKRTPQ